MGSRVLCINLSIHSISHRICTWFCCALFCISVIYWVPVDSCYPYIHIHDDVIKLKHLPRYWPFVRVIHRSPVNSPHKGQWRGALMFAFIYACISLWCVLGYFTGTGEVSVKLPLHYDDAIMGAIASQITSLTIVFSTVYSGADQSKHQSSASLAFVWRIHRGPVNSPHKWPVTRKLFPFDDVIME